MAIIGSKIQELYDKKIQPIKDQQEKGKKRISDAIGWFDDHFGYLDDIHDTFVALSQLQIDDKGQIKKIMDDNAIEYHTDGSFHFKDGGITICYITDNRSIQFFKNDEQWIKSIYIIFDYCVDDIMLEELSKKDSGQMHTYLEILESFAEHMKSFIPQMSSFLSHFEPSDYEFKN